MILKKSPIFFGIIAGDKIKALYYTRAHMRIITIGDNNYTKIFSFLKAQSNEVEDITHTVRAIINDVKNHGDVALVTYTNEFDKNELTVDQLRVTEQEIDEAYNATAPELIEALKLAADRIEAYQQKLKPQDITFTDTTEMVLSARYVPLDVVGICVTGESANNISSVLMNAIPARVAGVGKIIMICPTMSGSFNSGVLAAAKISGINEIYRIGGAQGVAAMTYGTGTIPKVDKIIGTGNAHIIEAKRQVFGEVGIDMLTGSSEILVLADENNRPEAIAADLLSQAEQDITARPILVTTSQNFGQRVITAVYDLMLSLERGSIARHAIENRGMVIIAQNMSEAVHISNLIAPEHLQLAVENPEELLDLITNAGMIFMGRYTPEAIGNYLAGPSSILPTASTSRFASGLGVADFLKMQSVIKCEKNTLSTLSTPVTHMAKAEGLTAHALSVLVRLKK